MTATETLSNFINTHNDALLYKVSNKKISSFLDLELPLHISHEDIKHKVEDIHNQCDKLNIRLKMADHAINRVCELAHKILPDGKQYHYSSKQHMNEDFPFAAPFPHNLIFQRKGNSSTILITNIETNHQEREGKSCRDIVFITLDPDKTFIADVIQVKEFKVLKVLLNQRNAKQALNHVGITNCLTRFKFHSELSDCEHIIKLERIGIQETSKNLYFNFYFPKYDTDALNLNYELDDFGTKSLHPPQNPFVLFDEMKKKYQNDSMDGFVKHQKNLTRILLNLAQALCHMHKKNIVHLDIKPDNFLVNYDCDYNIIQSALIDLELCCYSHQIHQKSCGTLENLAPEMAFKIFKEIIEDETLSEPITSIELTEKIDVFNFGMFVYRIYTQQLPNYSILIQKIYKMCDYYNILDVKLKEAKKLEFKLDEFYVNINGEDRQLNAKKIELAPFYMSSLTSKISSANNELFQVEKIYSKKLKSRYNILKEEKKCIASTLKAALFELSDEINAWKSSPEPHKDDFFKWITWKTMQTDPKKRISMEECLDYLQEYSTKFIERC